MNWTWADKNKTTVMATEAGVHHHRSVTDPEVAAWLAEGNVPDDLPRSNVQVRPFVDPALPTTEFTIDRKGFQLTVYRFESGQQLKWHKHTFKHYSTILKGRIKVRRINGEETLFDEMDTVWFDVGEEHELTALVDDTVCVQTVIW